jgi:hypothetical protein
LFPSCSREKEPLKTTAGTIALANLDGQIEDESRQLEQRANVERILHLIVLHSTRAELLGNTDDLQDAVLLGERVVTEFPSEGRAYFARARARTLVHQFSAANEDLSKALELGIPHNLIDDARATIAGATGRLEDALALLARAGSRDALHLGRRARIHAELGQLSRAEELFTRAEQEYSESSPFALAWVLGEHGKALERAGDVERAKSSYRAALARVPGLYFAGLALARLEIKSGDAEAARKRLLPLSTRGDPEAAAELASNTTGPAQDELLKHAADRYQILFARHPEAYAEHAAQFWLRAGKRPEQALAAAEFNLTVRENRTAYELALLAALAARNNEASCRLSHRANAKSGEIAKALAPLIQTAKETCPY